MEIKFWGVRGSIATPLHIDEMKQTMRRLLDFAATSCDMSTPEAREAILTKFSDSEPMLIGGNTTCLELKADGKTIIFDMGTGIRPLGNSIMAEKNGVNEFHIFLSHTHWDHISGFPFFLPAYLPQYKINFYSVHTELQERLEVQQDPRFFPVMLDQMSSTKEFYLLKENCGIQLGDLTIKNQLLSHPGKSYGYSINHGNKKFVLATDSEYKDISLNAIKHYVEFFKDADVLVFDSQYSFAEALNKVDWGHSSAITGIDLAAEANVKKLVLFHHEPENNLNKLMAMHRQAVQYKNINYPEMDIEIILAFEGLTLTI